MQKIILPARCLCFQRLERRRNGHVNVPPQMQRVFSAVEMQWMCVYPKCSVRVPPSKMLSTCASILGARGDPRDHFLRYCCRIRLNINYTRYTHRHHISMIRHHILFGQPSHISDQTSPSHSATCEGCSSCSDLRSWPSMTYVACTRHQI